MILLWVVGWLWCKNFSVDYRDTYHCEVSRIRYFGNECIRLPRNELAFKASQREVFSCAF